METSDDRKYLCVRRLAVPKRHNFCSSSSPLDTSGTYNHFLRLVDTIPRAPRRLPYTSKSFWAPSSNLGVFFQSSEILVLKGRAISITRHFPSFFSITTMSGLFASPPSNLFEAWSPTVFTRPYKTRASQQILIWVALRDGNFPAVTMLYYLFSFSFFFLLCLCVCVCFFLDYGYLVKLNIFTFQMRLGINCLCRAGVLIFIGL